MVFHDSVMNLGVSLTILYTGNFIKSTMVSGNSVLGLGLSLTILYTGNFINYIILRKYGSSAGRPLLWHACWWITTLLRVAVVELSGGWQNIYNGKLHAALGLILPQLLLQITCDAAIRKIERQAYIKWLATVRMPLLPQMSREEAEARLEGHEGGMDWVQIS